MRAQSAERRRFLRGLIVAVAGGVFLAVTGAFGSGGAPLPERLVYWIGIMVIGGLWGHVCAMLVSRFVDLDERPWLAVAVLTAVITGPLSVLVWAATGLFFVHRLYPLAGLPQLFVPVLIVTAAISALNVFLGRATPVQTHAASSATTARSVRFLERLPMKLKGAAIQAVQAEDHYLRIHTDRGSDLILMRLSDAVEELEGLEGAQTHRSWWVARDAVRGVERGDGRAVLTLEGGLRAPVSRRYARALREADWW
ncbi:LytTR family DNA-binding domain-containing protein [Brevundimonas sp. SORGH_AS_0993]|uniref:LytTR family DNA-binding domain-containing protein n=1 Tax=Brevundimonas sp. SORGH_AS_0993 TaxID=3041794 RepID=UPI00277F68E3|nr:LytTR family DNA-binding domain-containing protein [Brevundimonas sp. SORGH_AS_0993]MDQ1155103.1 DNA-binding LytR/AlgR family response regulator [Brevundimonas sp. SORGH_AS_0993]